MVKAEGGDPRLVLDSTSCIVNPRCHLPASIILPSAADVRFAFHALDVFGQFTAASIDFKAAHKQILVFPEEQGHCFSRHKASYMAIGSAISAPDFQPIGSNAPAHASHASCF